MTKIISFPHLGNYYIPLKYILKKISRCEVIIPDKNNHQTITNGTKYSPNEICAPFKYNLGNYLNALNKGANVLIQGGGGCRYGYFAELQEAILRREGYEFEFINLIKNNHVSIIKLYKSMKKLNKKLNIFSFIYYLFQGLLMMIFMDNQEKYLRENIGFEEIPNRFEKLEKSFLSSFSQKKLGIIKIIKIYLKYRRLYRSVPIKDVPKKEILLIGELYSLIDLESSHNLERTIAKKGFRVIRYTNLTYLLIIKKFMKPILLFKGRRYVKYLLGADGTESVVHSLDHAKKGISGIIHLKSFGCVPELNAIPILNRISNDYQVPIMYLSFEGENNIANIDTKLEAFQDMLNQNKN
jgi:predicted nucleotide-binding protein (sugar kinase/HSP70/actin superfamily)